MLEYHSHLVKQLNGNYYTTMVDSSTQLSYIELYKLNVNQGAKLNDGGKRIS
jgi:hypothetical protein